MTLIAPWIAENGNAVPIEVDAPGAEAVLILAPGNPNPDVATFAFGPMSGSQRATTRIRLAGTQDQPITREDIFNVTAMSYPNACRTEMTGEQLKVIFEDIAENIFNPDPYYQQGGDMVRIGGMGYRINPQASFGNRISQMAHLATGEPIDPSRAYVVAGWASVNEGTEGPPIWDVLEAHIRRQSTVEIEPNASVDVVSG